MQYFRIPYNRRVVEMNIEQFVNQLVHCHVGIYSFDQHRRRGYCILYPDKQNEILILKCVAFLTFGRNAINFFDRLKRPHEAVV